VSQVLPRHPVRIKAVTPPVCIFVVDDDETNIHVLDEALTDGGFNIRSETDCDRAMALLDTEATNFSALITDIDLHGRFTGWDLAKRAREINDKLPVIYITGSNSHEWASKGVPESQIIQKPFAIAQIVTAVSQLINNAAGS
jgi:DNA-binding NtrC family response regulator